MRKTKIICTLGPATDDPKILKNLMLAGMNTARVNFSHGTHAEQLKRVNAVKKLRKELDLPIALLLDTKGPEIRTRDFKDGEAELVTGQTFTLTPKDILGTNEIVSITYSDLAKDIKIDNKILIDDGLIEMVVVKIVDSDVICKVLNNGIVKNHKSVNVPGTNLSMTYLSDNDISDIKFGIENDFDFIAASFVRTAYDVLDIKRILEQNNGSDIQVISKIENRDGVNNIEGILKVSEGIMVARGDMGVEIPFEELPSIQKKLIETCYRSGKIVITATQMLESITHNPRPTRAETSDVANAVYDGTSAVMLSGETAVGEFPVIALATMARICLRTEEDINYIKRFNNIHSSQGTSVTNAISHSTCTTAHDLGATAIITVTKSGYTPRMISGFRPNCPIIAGALGEKVYRQLSLSWGVTPIRTEMKQTSDDLFEHAVSQALKHTNIVKKGDIVVLTGGAPVGISGTTNILKVQLVGDILLSGQSTSGKSASGKVCVAHSNAEALRKFESGDILVINETSNDIISLLRKATAIITEKSGVSSHAAVVGMTLDIPVLCGAENATNILKDGTTVTIDGSHGQVYNGVAKIM
ncbi:MAG: pyruvate kinase [Oscillospiraceae bacterium]